MTKAKVGLGSTCIALLVTVLLVSHLVALRHISEVVEIESGSATDNPLIFADTGEVISGGNFHGAPLALAFDDAGIAMTDLMSISERRIDRLVNPDLNEGLPAFLSRRPGTIFRHDDCARYSRCPAERGQSGFLMLRVSTAFPPPGEKHTMFRWA